MANEVAIIGIGLTRWGKYPDETFRELARTVSLEAIKDANLSWNDIKMLCVGIDQYSGLPGLTAGSTIEQFTGLIGIPTVNAFNACATGGYVLDIARAYILAGMYDPILCVGSFKAPGGFFGPIKVDSNDPADFDAQRFRLLGMTNPSMWGMLAVRRMYDYGMTEEDLALVKVKNSKHGALNPYARYQKQFTLEEVMNSPMVTYPLRLFEIAATSDGAAAMVLCSMKKARQLTTKPVILAGIAGHQPIYPLNDAGFCLFGTDSTVSTPAGERVQKYVTRKALEQAGIGPKDLDMAEVYDLGANLEFEFMEDIGVCKPGEAEKLLKEGATTIGGKIPINPSGGVSSFGESVPAQAMLQVCEIVMQLRGDAKQRQVKNAKTGITVNLGLGHNCSSLVLKK